MGLDQYAGTKNDEGDWLFRWRKHAKLHEFMCNVWERKHGGNIAERLDEFNCYDMTLDERDIVHLKQMVLDGALPHCDGGFFWGHQFQDESMREYREQDLKFCEWALEEIRAGREVYYSSWW